MQILKSIFFFLLPLSVFAQPSAKTDLRKLFQSPPESAKPWVFWYWLHGAVSAEGITADLEAMKEAGIGGAYLMPIKDTAKPSIYQPAARQLSPQWWQMIKHAMAESKRLGVQLAFHVSDGFALAGGPWITPEKSMQKVVWTQTNIQGGRLFSDTLARPKSNEGYYKDIAVYAFPSLQGTSSNTSLIQPKVTTSTNAEASFLLDAANTKAFTSEDSCWIQYEFAQPFTLRSLVIRSRTNYQSNRFIIEWSNDGKNFTYHTRLEPPRHGWQDWDSDYTHAIPEVTAKYFRFIYTKEGSEPGAEDLDAAKWKPVLKVQGIQLSSEPRIHQFEGKNGEVWRVSNRTSSDQLKDNLFVPQKEMVDVTKYMDAQGRLNWNVPAGNWTIIRMGHTSTGHRNDTGGGGKGLECDKFDPEAITLQFNNWFGEIMKQGGDAAKEVVKIFHVDSWECGSQNWSTVFREEFRKRRGYDPLPYLPVMAGIPVDNSKISEGFLYDVRKTVSELVVEKFYGTLQTLVHQKGILFSAESMAPTMLSDGMQHYSKVDLPMGEFWLRSATHDKPNDMLDAISGAHVYGKNIVQAEAFTQLRTAFDEHPGNLKALADRNFALGINRLVFHVFMHNPWMAKKPGITLDAIGLLFQRDQTWWPQAKAWVDYVKRCQALLQFGSPVTDVAVFTGEELPRRALLPERLVPVVPGVVGKEAVAFENGRLRNKGQPIKMQANGVTYVANTTDAQTWLDPLRGYAYDSYNPDALLRLSTVRNGRIQLSANRSYGLLLVPDAHKLSPDKGVMSTEVAQKIKDLAEAGATVILSGGPNQVFGLKDDPSKLGRIAESFSIHKSGLAHSSTNTTQAVKSYSVLSVGKGKMVKGIFSEASFQSLGIRPDVLVMEATGKNNDSIAWTHRSGEGVDIYFISNQSVNAKRIELSLRVSGKLPEMWDAVSGTISTAKTWHIEKQRTILPVQLEGSGSIFIVLRQPASIQKSNAGMNWAETKKAKEITGPWTVSFDKANGGPGKPYTFNTLTDWSKHEDSSIRYYSGKAVYQNQFNWQGQASKKSPVWLSLGRVANMAEVFVNDISCGIVWTTPYRADISKAIRNGQNNLRIEVINTWANRMIADSRLPVEKRITSTVYPFKMEGKPLLEAGLIGPVVIEVEQ